MEETNYLLNYKSLKIIQNEEWFKFSLDSVLLPNFVTINKRAKRIIDLGTGTAPIPLILSTKTSALIYGIEIQKEVYEMAQKTISLNKLNNQITIINKDIKETDKLFESDYFDVVTCNPPYFKLEDQSNLNKNEKKTIARHEMLINLDDIMKVSRKILKNNGYLALVHRPERLLEVFDSMRKYNIEPKKVRFVYSKVNKNCNIVLIEGRKNGNEGLKILPPLYIYDESNNYTAEVTKMFE